MKMKITKFFKAFVALLFICSCATPMSLSQNTEETPPSPATEDAEDDSEQNYSSVHFFTFGDGGTGDDNQKAVATALKDYCAENICEFGVLLGDNFYNSGVTSVTDPKWQTHFEDIYAGLNLPFFAALGNHDHQGNIQAQINYSDLQDRWKMPAAEYEIPFPVDSPHLLEIFVVDSYTFLPGDADKLDQKLKDSQARWKIIALHHPIYSNGNHGDSNFLQNTLLPVVCNQADVILSGHDHLFGHFEDTQDGCKFHQIVAGTGGRGLYASNPDPRLHFGKSAFGFTVLHVYKNRIDMEFIETDLSSPYQGSIEKN